MSIQDPFTLTLGDLCTQALKESGKCGLGQTPLVEEINDALFRLQTMLQQWERKRWLVYHIAEYNITSTGAQTYSVGPGGDINTGGASLAAGTSVRPARVEYAFLRQLTQNPPANEIDYPLQVLQSREDYSRIALKALQSFPGCVYLDPSWPLATLYTYPVPQANIYAIYLGLREQLPVKFADTAVKFTLPYEYYGAMLYNLALRLRSRWQIPSYPGDALPGMAKDALNVLRGSDLQLARLQMPAQLTRPGIYNIFSDRNY